MAWQLAEAKNKFSELFDRAISDGPQEITRRGKERVFVISKSDYEKLTGKRPSLKSLLMGENAPSFEGVDLSRDNDSGRKPPKL